MMRAWDTAYQFHPDQKYTPAVVDQMLLEIRTGRGVCLVDELNSRVYGMLMAYNVANIWDPTLIVMHGLVLWVDPEFRNTGMCFGLVEDYTAIGRKLLEEKKISAFTIGRIPQVPIDYSGFGFKPLYEEFYIS